MKKYEIPVINITAFMQDETVMFTKVSGTNPQSDFGTGTFKITNLQS